jgi:uncharacterized repeat protein (TIGR03803 family)
MAKSARWKTVCAILTACAAMATTQAQTYTRLAAFERHPDGSEITAGVVQGVDGALYGTASHDGVTWGTVFKMDRTGLAPLYQFCVDGGPCTDGSVPQAGLVLATDLNFYGTTVVGGAPGCYGSNGCGTIFRISRTGSLTTIHSFDITDGSEPTSSMIQATDGNLYGTTLLGGGVNLGTVFRADLDGTLTTVHSFDGTDGTYPSGRVLQAIDGNLYGTTDQGGPNGAGCDGYGCGTVYRITSDGVFQSLYAFCSQANCTDGASPYAGLVQGIDGNLYGTTTFGGQFGQGTVFQVTLGGTLTTLYSFCSQAGCPDGSGPVAPLFSATDGNLYGTTNAGGNSSGRGTIFKLSLDGVLTTLHSFCQLFGCVDGSYPEAGLTQGTDGNFYGTTAGGGAERAGVVYRLSVGLGPFVALVHGAAKVDQKFGILGQGFIGTTAVSLNGTPASFTAKSATFIEATVPTGATTGYVTVTTPTGTLTSNVPFHVIP